MRRRAAGPIVGASLGYGPYCLWSMRTCGRRVPLDGQPWFIAIKQTLAGWLIERDILWPFNTNAPWFLLTHYPRQNDVFNWLDGGLLITYIIGTGLIYGTALIALLALANLCLGKWRSARLHHL